MVAEEEAEVVHIHHTHRIRHIHRTHLIRRLRIHRIRAVAGLVGFEEAAKRVLHRLREVHQHRQRAAVARKEAAHHRILATKKRLHSRPVMSVLLHTAIIMGQTFTIVALLPITFDRCRIHINATFNLSSQTLKQVSVNVFAQPYFL